MLDAFLEHPFFLNRHRQAPLLKERELFLSHLQQVTAFLDGLGVRPSTWSGNAVRCRPSSLTGERAVG